MPTRHAPDRLETTTDDTFPTPTLTVRLTPGAAVRFERARDRNRVRLLFGSAGVGPDVSFQPAAVDRVVRDHARLAGIDPNRWCGEVVTALVDWAPGLDGVERRPEQLVAVVGAFTHPLLGALYREGREPLGEVPRWASPILRAPDAGEAGRRLCHGPTTRRVTRSLARALVARADTLDVELLALAVAGAGMVTDDELANLLDVPPSDEPVPAPLSVEEVRAIRTGLGWYPADRRAPLLVDVARNRRAVDLATASGRLRWVIDSAPRPLPVRLAALEDLCGRLVPVVADYPAPPPPPEPAPPSESVAAAPTPAAAPPVPPQPRADRTARRRAPRGEVPHPAETADRPPVRVVRGRERPARPERPAQLPRHPPAAPATTPSAWPVHPDLLAVSELRVGDLTMCVPTSVAELGAWSRRLSNCLDTFGAAVAHGRSWVIGIRRDDELVGAVEICPATRRLRQAQGPRNRPLPTAVYDEVVAALGETGVLRVHRRR